MKASRTQVAIISGFRAIFVLALIPGGLYLISSGVITNSYRNIAAGIVALLYAGYMINWILKARRFLKQQAEAREDADSPPVGDNSIDPDHSYD